MKTLRDTWLMYRRSLILTLRQPVWVIMGLFQPILYLLLFAPLLEGATSNAGAPGNAFNWFIPGLLILTGFFAAAFAGFGLVAEIRYGVVERMRVTPMSRFAMLAGRSLRDVTILLAQSTLLILVGRSRSAWRSIPPGRVLTLGIVALVGLTFSPAVVHRSRSCSRARMRWRPSLRRSPCRCSCCRGSCCRWRSRRTGSRPSRRSTR